MRIYLQHHSQLDKLNKMSFIEKLLEKDVKKSKISSEEAEAVQKRVKTISNVSEFAKADVQLVMEVRQVFSLPGLGHKLNSADKKD